MRKVNIQHKGKVHTFQVKEDLDVEGVRDLIEQQEMRMFMNEQSDPQYKTNGKKDRDDAILKALNMMLNEYPAN